MPFFNDAGSHRSPAAVSARSSAMLSVLLDGRTSNRSSAPCAASARATWLPTNPVAPVMKAFILLLYPERSEGPLSEQHCLGTLQFAISRKSVIDLASLEISEKLFQCFRLDSDVFFPRGLLLPVFSDPGFKALTGSCVAACESQRGNVGIRNRHLPV